MIRRTIIVAYLLSVASAIATLGLRVRSYANGYWVQTSPPGTVYAFKVWGELATVYRLNQWTPYPNRQAVIFAFSIDRVLLVSVIGAGASILGLFRPRRRIFDRCSTCGYDLRASRERCPECGNAFGRRDVGISGERA